MGKSSSTKDAVTGSVILQESATKQGAVDGVNLED